MQAITIAIGKNGIQFFVNQYLKPALLDLLDNMKPPDYSTTIPDFNATDPFSTPFQTITDEYSNINIQLNQGSFSQFAPTYQSATQGTSGNGGAVFTLQFSAGPFGVTYQWLETYDMDKDYQSGGVKLAREDIPSFSNTFTYAENFQGMSIQAVVQFAFDTQKNAWVFDVLQTAATTNGAISNIPSGSVVHRNDAPCTTNHLIAATQAAINALNFSAATQSQLSGIVQTIPGSGDLGNGMTYDFSVGDSGILFPNNDGIQMGVKGGASYQGEPFAGDAPSLPLPPPLTDADSHHLNLFVSASEVAALCWCFFKAGKLNLVVGPGDLQDPTALKVSQYTALEKSLNPYSAFVMQAQIVQNAAPVPAFQTVYVFGEAVMDQLKTALPAGVFQQILFLEGSAFASKEALETALQSNGVAGNWFGTLETAATASALVLVQDITMTLVIQNGQPSLPNIVFQVQRTDLLNGLQLGIGANQRQTLQFGFANAGNSASYISSTVPGFDGTVFESRVWPLLAETNYEEVLESLGKTGVPLPIMAGFQFDFDQAAITLENGYVSILANLIYKNQ